MIESGLFEEGYIFNLFFFLFPTGIRGKANPRLGQMREILLTFAAYHDQVGYAQGMNDILSRFLYIMESEVGEATYATPYTFFYGSSTPIELIVLVYGEWYP